MTYSNVAVISKARQGRAARLARTHGTQWSKKWRKCVKTNMAKEENAIRKFVVRELHKCSDLR